MNLKIYISLLDVWRERERLSKTRVISLGMVQVCVFLARLENFICQPTCSVYQLRVGQSMKWLAASFRIKNFYLEIFIWNMITHQKKIFATWLFKLCTNSFSSEYNWPQSINEFVLIDSICRINSSMGWRDLLRKNPCYHWCLNPYLLDSVLWYSGGLDGILLYTCTTFTHDRGA